MTSGKAITLLAIRANMGTWVYYVTTMTLHDIRERIKKTDEIHKSEKLRDMIQRALTARTKEITEYLVRQPQRFFNAIVVGIYGGEPEWYQIKIEDNPKPSALNPTDQARKSIGLLKLTGKEKIFAIDGQHRVQAIKDALQRESLLGNEELCVIFVGHKTDDIGREQTRRLFTTLNKHAKAVLPGEIVALDEDDVFAIVTRKLVDEYEPLSGDRVLFAKTAPIPPKERKCITTILTLFNITEVISAPKADKLEYRRLKNIRPHDEKILEIYEQQCALWDALRAYVPSIKEVTDSDPKRGVAGKYRTPQGGLVLFRPAGQRAFAQAVRVMMDRGMSIRVAVGALSKKGQHLSAKPWLNVLWDQVGKRMVKSVNYQLAQNLFLRLAGQETNPLSYDLLGQYKKALGDEEADVEKDLQTFEGEIS
jgi:DNA sulfur modification protein DndB